MSALEALVQGPVSLARVEELCRALGGAVTSCRSSIFGSSCCGSVEK